VRRVFVNTSFKAISITGRLLIGLALTPFLVYMLGVENFGLWAVLSSVVGYFSVLDFGLGGGLVRFFTGFCERDERVAAKQVFWFALLFYACFALVLAPLVYFLAPLVVGVLRLSQANVPIAILLFRLIFVQLVLLLVAGVFGALIVALHRMDLTSGIDFVAAVFYAALTVTLVKLQFGLLGLVYAGFAQFALTIALQSVVVHRLFGSLWYNPLRVPPSLARKLLSFGSWMQISSIATILTVEANRFILGAFVGVASVAYYEVGNKLAMLGRTLPLTFVGALMPAASALDARDERVRLDELYVRATRYLAFATFLLAGFIVGASDRLVQVWMGRSFPYAGLVAVVLVTTYAVNNLTGVGTTIVRAIGEPRYETYYAVVGAALTLVLCLTLTPHYGLVGLISATAFGTLVSSLYFMWLFHRIRRLPWRANLGRPLAQLTLVATSCAGVLWLVSQQIPPPIFHSRTTGFAVIAALGLLYLGAFVAGLRVSGFWTYADREAFARLVPDRFSRYLAFAGAPQ
jgi:O-antigen/teichoic acid export membrane protein